MDNLHNIFEKSVTGRRAYWAEPMDEKLSSYSPKSESSARSTDINWPEVSELEIIRHFTELSQRNFSVDTHFYPLGSCTMKYNPRANEKVAAMPVFLNMHPYMDERYCQGLMSVIYDMEQHMAELCGFDAVTLQPAAGAHGELTALLVAREYFRSKNDPRSKIIVIDSSHGTNPASASIAGFSVKTLPSNADGEIDLDMLEQNVDETVAVVMLTNPNTLGLFERKIDKIAEIAHAKGALIYCDGANFNAMMGVFRPGDAGADMMHVNLHKTFSTPHGCGGPGSGPIGVKDFLAPFLPVPRVRKKDDGSFFFDYDCPDSIGRVKAFFGHVNVFVKAYAYILQLGGDGLRDASQMAVLNANYLKHLVSKKYKIAYPRTCMHEFVAVPPEKGIHTLDIAKRLVDYGFHPPTVYFPLIVREALMIEPTETETKEEMERFAEALCKVLDDAVSDPELVHNAPTAVYCRRLDEVGAARRPVLKHKSGEAEA